MPATESIQPLVVCRDEAFREQLKRCVFDFFGLPKSDLRLEYYDPAISLAEQLSGRPMAIFCIEAEGGIIAEADLALLQTLERSGVHRVCIVRTNSLDAFDEFARSNREGERWIELVVGIFPIGSELTIDASAFLQGEVLNVNKPLSAAGGDQIWNLLRNLFARFPKLRRLLKMPV